MNKILRYSCLLLILSFGSLVDSSLDAQDFRAKVDQNLAQLKSNSDTLRFDALINLATFYNFLPDKSDSVGYYAQQAYALSQQNDIAAWHMKANYYKGLFHQRYSSDLDSAIFFFTNLEKVIQESGRTEKLGATYNALGVVWYSKGNYTKALEYYTKVLGLSEKENDIVALTNANLSIGSVYSDIGEYEKAISSMKEALAHNKRDTTPDQPNVYLNTSLNLLSLYMEIDSMEEARVLMDSMEQHAMVADYVPYRDRFLNQKLTYFEKTGQKEELARLAKEQYANLSASKFILPHIRNTISYYYGKSLIEEGRISEVPPLIAEIKNQEISEQMDFKVARYSYLHELSKGINDYEASLDFLEKQVELSDSIINEKSTAALQELFAKYEIEKRERQLKEAENDKLRLRRNVFRLLAVLLGVTIVTVLYYLYTYRRRQKEKEEIYNIEQKMLSLQMNPHFIFNAISSIQNYLFDEGDTKKALQHLSTFSNLMRQILENSREKFIPLEDEIAFLANYLKLQKLRYDERFDYEIEVDPDIDVESVSIPPLLTQPFVENAIEHGDLHKVNDGKVKIIMSVQKQQLMITVEDNGKGMESNSAQEETSGSRKSLAIKITQERLALLNKLMNNNFSMNIESEVNKGTLVKLKIPTIYL